MSFLYDEQIASQPEAVRAVLAQDFPLLDPGRPIVFAGLGSSLHACRIAVHWSLERRAAAERLAIDAHSALLSLPLSSRDQLVLVSHGGRGRFAAPLLEKARAAGAFTAAVVGQGAPALPCDALVRTCPEERAGTHSVSYTSALAALGGMLGFDLGAAPAVLAAALAEPAPLAAARQLAGREPLLVAGFGVDAISADEGALKLKEGAFVWAEGLDVEQAIHGPLIALRPGMGAIVLHSARDGGRAAELARACAALGAATVELPEPASCPELLRPFASVVPLQRLAAELARLTGGDPDQTRKDQEPWKSALPPA